MVKDQRIGCDLPGIPAPPSALHPHGELLVCLPRLTEPLDPSDLGPRSGWGRERDPLREALKGLVQALKGALLPSGARA